jgi:hypothetical protein
MAMDLSIDNTRKRHAVAQLIGYAEGIVSSGILGEPSETRLRGIIAEAISAFGMQHHDERNAA